MDKCIFVPPVVYLIPRNDTRFGVVRYTCGHKRGKYLVQQAATPAGERLWGDGVTAGHLGPQTQAIVWWCNVSK